MQQDTFPFYNPEFFCDGFPLNGQEDLPTETSFVKSVNPEDGRAYWFSVTYDALLSMSTSPQLFSSELQTILIDTPGGDELERQRNFLLNMDPPRHKKMRDNVSRAFATKNILRHEAMIREVVTRVFDGIAPDTPFDAVTDLATPIALEIICRIVGVDPKHLAFINACTNRMIYTDDPSFCPSPIEGKLAASQLFIFAMKSYQDRENVSSDTVLALLCNSLNEGENITQEEFCFLFVLILAAGYETTRSMINSMLYLLAENPDQLDKLRRGECDLDNAVEEFLRYEPPIYQMCRTAVDDVVFKGCPMHRGEKIGMLYHAANHDEKVFNEPYHLDLARENADKHLSFGIGRHNCLGATLARLELKIVLERLVRDFPRITIHDKVRIRSNFINGLKTMKTELHSL